MTKVALTFWCMSIGSCSAFAPAVRYSSSVGSQISSGVTVSSRPPCAGESSRTGCNCPRCQGATHKVGCNCPSCANKLLRTVLFSDASDDNELPAEIEAMDGVESKEEAHNLERPARQKIQKKKQVEGKSLSEFKEGSTVTGTIKSIAAYGAFVDIGATTDGLLHVSQLSTEFVSSVGDVVSAGQKVDVRIINIDSGKGQVGLSLISEEDASNAKVASRRPRGGNRRQGGGRRDDSAILNALTEKGWDKSVMVKGSVVSTTDFGAFVKVDASELNSECEGEFEGLVHISALSADRVGSVTDVVNTGDSVQVRCTSVDDNKVSLTMLSVEDEEKKATGGSGGGGGTRGGEERSFALDLGDMGASDWQESIDEIIKNEPVFSNKPLVLR